MKQTIKLSESELKSIIAESLRKILKETRFDPKDNYLPLGCEKGIRRERVANAISENVMRRLYEGEENSDMKRNAVMKALKDPKFNHAQLAYSLWPDMDKDTARSLFAKMANGTPDNDGVVRNFSDEDINSLYQMIRKR